MSLHLHFSDYSSRVGAACVRRAAAGARPRELAARAAARANLEMGRCHSALRASNRRQQRDERDTVATTRPAAGAGLHWQQCAVGGLATLARSADRARSRARSCACAKGTTDFLGVHPVRRATG